MNPIIGYRNFLDLSTTSLSGGDWRAALPLANLQDRRLSKIARSTTDATADAQFDVDLGAAREVRVVSLHAFNLTLSGTIRIRGYTGAGHTGEVFDTTATNPYSTVYPSNVLEAGHPAAGGNALVAEDYDDGYPVNFVYVINPVVSPRYLWVEINDTSNPDGYIDIGRMWVTYGYKPSHGVSTGARLGYDTTSKRRETDGGSAYFNERARRRRFEFSLDQFNEDESLVYLLEMNRLLGTHRQCLLVGDADASNHMHRLAFVGTLENLSPLEMARSQWNDQGFRVLEEV